MNLKSSILNLKGIFQEQAFSQNFRSSISGRMGPTSRKAFLVSGPRRAEVNKVKNIGGKKKLAKQPEEFRKVHFGESCKYYPEPPCDPEDNQKGFHGILHP